MLFTMMLVMSGGELDINSAKQSENSGVGSDAEGEGENDHRGIAGAAAQGAEGVDQAGRELRVESCEKRNGRKACRDRL